MPSAADAPAPIWKLHPRLPSIVGRYVVESRLGEGGMGVVHVAHDPQLDRRVALKLLHPQRELGPAARARFLREAQALARLSHPNVVAVHDVGTVGERTYLAMELVVGRTLAAWLAEAPRSWPQVLDAFVPAGEGLAAVHAAGLVHRDFKPGNVMLGDDGRVRVLDFGLARAERTLAADAGDWTEAVDDGETEGDLLSTPVTRTGALLGTPAYMAPEQWRGESPDARSDQFSYCVSLWEALYGEPPFGRGPIPVLADRVLRGDVRAATRSSVPAWLESIVRRGLAVDPAQRWPSQRALLSALERGRAREHALACACEPPDPRPRILEWLRRALLGLAAALRRRRAAPRRCCPAPRSGPS
jgi:eukaryotic-like serine/threonine-protein kinase